MKVWEYIKKPQNFVKSRFCGFSYEHYLYTFLCKFLESQLQQRFGSILNNAVQSQLLHKTLHITILVNPQKSGENPKRWRDFCIDNAFKELSS